jgi:hypothetical protein
MRLFAHQATRNWFNTLFADETYYKTAFLETLGRHPLPLGVIVGCNFAGSTSVFEALARFPNVFPVAARENNNFQFGCEDKLFEYNLNHLFYFAHLARVGALPELTGDHGAAVGELLELADVMYRTHTISTCGLCPLPDADEQVLALDQSLCFEFAEAPRMVEIVHPDAKIVIITRDPVDRAYSNYQRDKLYAIGAEGIRRSDPYPAFEDLVPLGDLITLSDNDREGLLSAERTSYLFRYIVRGLYDLHLTNWLEVFGRDRVLLIDNIALRADPETEMRRALEFFGLNWPTEYAIDLQSEYKGNAKEYKELDPVSRSVDAALRQFYRRHVDRFVALAGQDFTWAAPYTYEAEGEDREAL